MKKKQDTLLNKLKQENQTISYSTNVLSDIKSLVPKLKTKTLLIEKIEKIKKLQQDNRLDSSKRILKILNDRFEYSYPFFYTAESHSSYRLLHRSDITPVDTLKNHIKREAQLNQRELSFYTTEELIDRMEKLHSEKVSSNFYNGNGIRIFLGVNFFSAILLYSSFFSSSAVSLVVIFNILLFFFWMNYLHTVEEIKRLKKLIDAGMEFLEKGLSSVN